jgi:hypothetical protein
MGDPFPDRVPNASGSDEAFFLAAAELRWIFEALQFKRCLRIPGKTGQRSADASSQTSSTCCTPLSRLGQRP